MNKIALSGELEKTPEICYDLAMRFFYNVVKKHMENMLFKKRKFNIKDLKDSSNQELMIDPKSCVDLIHAIHDPESDYVYLREEDLQSDSESWYDYYHEGVHNVEEDYRIDLYTEPEMEFVEKMLYDYEREKNLERPTISLEESVSQEPVSKTKVRKHVVSGYLVKDRRLLLVYYRKLKNWAPVGRHITWDIEGENPDDIARENLKETFLDLTKINPNILELNMFQILCSTFKIKVGTGLDHVVNGPVLSFLSQGNYHRL